MSGHTDIVRALIAAGAGVNIEDQVGTTPLHWASYHGHTDIVRALIAAEAGVNIAHRGGRTLLQVSIQLKRIDIIFALREAGGLGPIL